MTMYAGFDVSDKTTHICVVDADGAVLTLNPPGRDHEGSDHRLTQPSDDLEDNHWHREKRNADESLN